MQPMVTNPSASPTDFAVTDLGPLAWVLDELRKSLDGASKALKRFASDAEAARGSDLAALDASQLRIARQQLHQAVGALEMVGLVGPALLLRAMETAVQKFVQQPEHCTRDAVAKIEFASFALTEYLEGLLADKPFSPVSLFPQYRDVLELVRAERIHPADLWSFEWRWIEPQSIPVVRAERYGADVRAIMDQSVLQLMKGKAPQAGLSLRDLSLGFAAQQTNREHRIFWLIAAAYFEALAQDLLGSDIYVRRAASRILLQYASLAREDAPVSEQLALDLLFFCAQAGSSTASGTPVLAAVRTAYRLTAFTPVNYESVRFGRFDPALMAKARKRIVAAKEAWSSLCAGDLSKARLVADQFSLVTDSLRKLHAPSESLAEAMSQAIDTTLRTGSTPAIALAIEVATSVLYLESVFDDLDPNDSRLAQRTASLAERLERVRVGGELQPLESWMEELYRSVSDKQTMGSVVGELRVALGEIEHSLDLFFRDPQDKTRLHAVPGQLSHMRGVLSVLGLDQASKAVLSMRSSVEQLLDTEIEERSPQVAETFEHLGSNLGALSFLIDMLNYQPALAKKLFVYDEEKGELESLMGRAKEAVRVAPADGSQADKMAGAFEGLSGGEIVDGKPVADRFDSVSTAELALSEVASETPLTVGLATALPTLAEPAEPFADMDFENDDLQDIFLDEAREVIANAEQAITYLVKDPVDDALLPELRRAFHTLKGSARMVGLAAFGEAAWALEQMLNSWLADQKAATKEFRTLCSEAVVGLKHWVAAIEVNQASSWSASPFRTSAEAMRIEGRYIGVELPGVAVPALAADEMAAGFWPAAQSHPAGSSAFDIDPSFLHTAPEASKPAQIDEAQDTVEPVSASMDDQPSGIANEGKTDETVKVIDGLRIGIPLYNVYLNEADEWSRRLVNEVAEWALESHQPVSASTVALAHSLAGSSATVGFDALSGLARSLEQALQNSRNHHINGALAYGQIFVDASEEIRRLLHQFAAGFLKQPRPDILEHLNELEFADSAVSELYDDGLFFVAEPGQSENTASETATGVHIDPVSEAVHDADAGIPGGKFETGNVDRKTAATVAAFHEDNDDGNIDIDIDDAIDPDLFPIFEEEGAELMPRLGAALRQWAERPNHQSARPEVLRVLHTLKGSARLAGALRLGEMAHRMESEIAFIGNDAVASEELEFLLGRFDSMQAAFDALRQAVYTGLGMAEPAVETLPPPTFAAAPLEAVESDATPSNDAAALTKTAEALADADLSANVVSVAIPAPRGLAMQPVRHAASASIRVRTQLLDRMVNQAGEVMITRSRLEAEIGHLRNSLNDMGGSLTRLRQQLRDIELQSETQMQSRLALAKEDQAGFDPLEFDRFTRVQELTRMMAESVNDVATVQRTLQRTVEATEDDLIAQGRQTRELQRDLLRTRMVEFEAMSERLYRVVRQASKETGKQVRLDLLGGNLEMDRGMLDRMMPAFEHLLRNSVTHGIEDAQVRVDAGKPAAGLITIHLRHEGNDVSVDFSDDGRGLDLRRIREKALKSGLVAVGELDDDAAAAEMIFTPGFSTADQVTELAGRGIGMDVVRSEVNALGGRIETLSAPEKGTHFKLVLPLTTAVTQVVMVRAGSLSVGVPTNMVETVRRASVKELAQAYSAGTFDVGGEQVPFFWSGALLQSSHYSSETQGRTLSVVIFKSAAQRVAMHVDEVLGNREVVVKHLGPQLSRLPGLAGMSVLPSGSVVLIYNPVALAVVYGKQARAWSVQHNAGERRGLEHASEGDGVDGTGRVHVVPTAPQIPLVLVVDDSITVRRVTQRLLLREGYRVSMAADGLQALERLQEEIPAVVLTDIEMPRMDGFDLARNIRADARLNHLPIIMITSRIAQKHNEHATELGVNHYLGKPYSEDELIRLIRQYCATEAFAFV